MGNNPSAEKNEGILEGEWTRHVSDSGIPDMSCDESFYHGDGNDVPPGLMASSQGSVQDFRDKQKTDTQKKDGDNHDSRNKPKPVEHSPLGRFSSGMGQLPADFKALAKGDVLIPDITRAHDFDPENPRHLRAFDEEMTEMLRKALQRQALTNSHSGQHGKMSRRETELAMQGFNISSVRNKATAAELYRRENEQKSAMESLHGRQFSRNWQEGAKKDKKIYYNRMKSADIKTERAAESAAKAIASVTKVMNEKDSFPTVFRHKTAAIRVDKATGKIEDKVVQRMKNVGLELAGEENRQRKKEEDLALQEWLKGNEGAEDEKKTSYAKSNARDRAFFEKYEAEAYMMKVQDPKVGFKKSPLSEVSRHV